MSQHYDNWERLVRAVMLKEELRRIALRPSMDSISISSASSSFRAGSTYGSPMVNASFSFSRNFAFPAVNSDDQGTMARSESLSFFLDERSGKTCYMFGARGLQIASVEDSQSWRWKTQTDPRRNSKMDSMLPKALEFAVELDVQNIACGGRHAILVTEQGEIFSWGEELSGRLGHGVDSDVLHPKLIDTLSDTSIELVACGENHFCAVTLSGDLYTWGDGRFGSLGHGNEVSHWVPKRVNGPLEGIHVSFVSCGPWHTAVVTSAGQLFTFGDGTFGVLGHGNRLSVSKPREVESLTGLRTVRAACGVWHTAAVVEVVVGSSNSSNCSSGKLFTWGDGDKGLLGHGDKEARLVPTFVSALVEPNFCQVACGQRLTVALTTSGHVYTMGSPAYGQLGCPQSDGKLPARVEGKLLKSYVEEISCGAYHVAVLTSRTEVYSWGKGANGRLGHGDTDDRYSPTLVDVLKDKQVTSISCGTNFMTAICLHKWVSGIDQSMCSGCHLPFNFKRKRHNCYNCGLVFCHSCSSKKSQRASMAPNPNKACRVCDNCFNKLKKAIETDTSTQSSVSRRASMNRWISDIVEKMRSWTPDPVPI